MKIDPNYKFKVAVSKEQLINKTISNAMIGEDTESNMAIREKYGLKSLHFEIRYVTPRELQELLKDGHCMSHIFNSYNAKRRKDDDLPYFSKGSKYIENFVGASCICVDVDHTDEVLMLSYIGKLDLKPTISYTTYSNHQIDQKTGEDKGLRFRMIYVFDDWMDNYYWFRYCGYCLNKYILSRVNPGEELDICNIEATQYFNGTYQKYDPYSDIKESDKDENGNPRFPIKKVKVEYGSSNRIYSLSEFGVTKDGYIEFLKDFCKYMNDDKPQDLPTLKNRERHSVRINRMLEKLTGKRYDLNRELYVNSEGKTKSHFFFTEKATVENVTAEVPEEPVVQKEIETPNKCSGWTYAVLRANPLNKHGFRAICREFHRYELFYRTEPEDGWIQVDKLINGKRYEWIPAPECYIELSNHVLLQGKNRIAQIYIRTLIRRLIKPSAEANELLLNAISDVVYRCENSDGRITPKEIINSVNLAMGYTIEEIKERPEVICHIPYLSQPPKDGILIREVKEDAGNVQSNTDDRNDISVRKYIRYQRIHDVCDPEKTDKENIIIVKDKLGIDISAKTLMRIRKEYGEMKYQHHI